MKCPYIWNTVEMVHPKKVRYTAVNIENYDGTPDRLHMTSNDSSYTRQRFMHDCITEDCGAYQNGHCVRRS